MSPCWHSPGCIRAFHDVAPDNVALIGRDSCGEVGTDRNAAIGVLDLARGEIKRIDIGDASRAVSNTVGLGRALGVLMGEDDAQPAVRLFNSLDTDGCPEPDSDPLALGAQARPHRHPWPVITVAALRES